MSYQLTIEPLGQTIEVEEGQTILDAALRAGIYLPHACCHGLCATCKVQVVDGEVEHGAASSFALMDFERDEQKCLACCATPQSDLVIEAEIDEDADARNLPVNDYMGTVSRIESLTPTIKGVWIKLDDPAGIDFQVGQYVTGDGIANDRANRHVHDDVVAAFAVAIGASPAFAVLGEEFAGVAVVDEGVDVAVGNDIDAAAATTVAAIRTAHGDVFFPAEGGNAVAALAGDDQDLGFVDEFHRV